MRRTSFALACLGSLTLAGAASAAISGQATVVDAGSDVDGNTIWRVLLESDNTLDKFLAVNGDANVSPLQFQSTGALVNRGASYGVFTAAGDKLRPPFAGNDSYLALGDNAMTGNVQFSPGFLGSYTSAYSPAGVAGTFFSQADNGGYFDSNPTTAVNPDANGQVLIAQFILAPGETFEFSGTASYNDGDTGALTNIRFSTVPTGPTPGACCLDDLCSIEFGADCADDGGIFFGEGSVCSPALCDGACCLPDGTCAEISQSLCAAMTLSGQFQGVGQLCEDVTCIPFGACCLDDTICSLLTESECAGVSGHYAGDDARCDTTLCLPRGACCLDDATCTESSTDAECTSAGGLYQGFLTQCADVECRGACVFADASCNDGFTPDECAAAGGSSFQGGGSTCTETNPQSVVQCVTLSTSQNSSTNVSFDQFDDAGGLRILHGVRLETTGDVVAKVILLNLQEFPVPSALDYSDEVEVRMPDFGPAASAGRLDAGILECTPPFLDPGASCDYDSPLLFPFDEVINILEPADLSPAIGAGTIDAVVDGSGAFGYNGSQFILFSLPYQIELKLRLTYEFDLAGACCFTDGSCLVLTDDECNDQAGTYQGEGTTCADVMCPGGGACCLPDGTCEDASNDDDCVLAKGGTYQGDDTMCKATTCTCRPPDIEYTGPCMEICNETTTCTASGDTNYTFSVLNNSGVDVHWLLLVPEDGTTITPQVVHVVPPLPNGEARAFDLVIAGGSGSTCFDLVLCDINVNECCSGEVCIDLAQCCGRVFDESITCTGPGAYTYSFELENQTSEMIHHLFVLDPSDTLTIDPIYTAIDPPLAPGDSLVQVIQISGADVENCILLTIHNENFTASCSVEACLSGGCVNFNPCDIDQDGSVGFTDLVRVLGAWGPCPAEAACVEDVSGDGSVGFDDVVEVLAQWSEA